MRLLSNRPLRRRVQPSMTRVDRNQKIEVYEVWLSRILAFVFRRFTVFYRIGWSVAKGNTEREKNYETARVFVRNFNNREERDTRALRIFFLFFFFFFTGMVDRLPHNSMVNHTTRVAPGLLSYVPCLHGWTHSMDARSLISFLLGGEKVFCAPSDRILKPWPVKMGHKCAPKEKKSWKEGGRDKSATGNSLCPRRNFSQLPTELPRRVAYVRGGIKGRGR